MSMSTRMLGVDPSSSLAARTRHPALLLNAMGAAGIRWTDLQRTRGMPPSWVSTLLAYAPLHATVAHIMHVHPLRYDLDTAVDKALQPASRSWLASLLGFAPPRRIAPPSFTMPICAMRDSLDLAPDMAAAVTIAQPPAQVAGSDGSDVCANPIATLEVRTLQGLVRGLSFRQRTLERFRAQLEPHRWVIPADVLAEYAVGVESHAALTPLGRGHAIQPSLPGGELFEKCRQPVAAMYERDAKDAADSDADVEDLHLQLLHNDVGIFPALEPNSPVDAEALTSMLLSLPAGGAFRSGSRHLWSGLVAWVRANFAQASAADDASTAFDKRCHRVPFPVRVLVTVLPEARIHDPVVEQPRLMFDESIEGGLGGFRGSSQPSRFSMRGHSRPSGSVAHGRILLRAWQEELLLAWRHALPDPGSVVAVAPETVSDVAGVQRHAAASLRSSLRVRYEFAGFGFSSGFLTLKMPVLKWNYHVDIINPSTGAVHTLPPGIAPVASPHADDPLTLLSDVLAAGPPQPYRPPVAVVAREVLRVSEPEPAGATGSALVPVTPASEAAPPPVQSLALLRTGSLPVSAM